MFNASGRAIEKLREQLVRKCYQANIGFRVDVNVDGAGKETFSIRLDHQHPEDKVIESDGIKILVDPSSALRISGYKLDYRDEADGGFSLNKMQEVKVEQK
jgi:iron-sulfur cluster assembly protein